MLKVLLRSRMEALLSVLTGAGRTKKAQSKGKLIGFATLMLLSLFSLGILFARIFEVLATPLSMLGIESDLAQPVSAFSHGMKQKLALIAAWIHEPRLILMDEPFVGLDPKAAFLLKELMHRHCDKGGAIFFSTHVLEVAEKLCDKVAIIKQGSLVMAGPMEDVKGDDSLEEVFLELEAEA